VNPGPERSETINAYLPDENEVIIPLESKF